MFNIIILLQKFYIIFLIFPRTVVVDSKRSDYIMQVFKILHLHL